MLITKRLMWGVACSHRGSSGTQKTAGVWVKTLTSLLTYASSCTVLYGRVKADGWANSWMCTLVCGTSPLCFTSRKTNPMVLYGLDKLVINRYLCMPTADVSTWSISKRGIFEFHKKRWAYNIHKCTYAYFFFCCTFSKWVCVADWPFFQTYGLH